MSGIITRSLPYKNSRIWEFQFGILETMLPRRWWIVGAYCWALMDTYLNLKHLSVDVVYSHTISCVLMHYLNHTHSPLWYAYFSWSLIIGPFWAPCRRPFLGQQRQSKDYDPFRCIFSWICLKMKMASVVPCTSIKPNCISSTFITFRMISLITRSTTVNICSVSFAPQ